VFSSFTIGHISRYDTCVLRTCCGLVALKDADN
jgi:hypothetical protein